MKDIFKNQYFYLFIFGLIVFFIGVIQDNYGVMFFGAGCVGYASANMKNWPTKKLGDLDGLIMKGINITQQAQEGNALYSENQFLAVDVHHRFILWRFDIQEFVSKYYPKKAQEFFEADSVPDLKGGVEYGDVYSEKSQTLLKNIREETSKKLTLLRQLKKRERWWEKTWVQILFILGALAGIISLLFSYLLNIR